MDPEIKKNWKIQITNLKQTLVMKRTEIKF